MMGVLTNIVLIWLAIAGHAAYNSFLRTPEGGVVVQDFPKDFSKSETDAIISNRKIFIKDMMDVFHGKLEDSELLKW